MTTQRTPAVAGLFYPEGPEALEAKVRSYLADADGLDVVPKALIAPHAGYAYSGPIAAHAYRLLEPLRGAIRRIVLLGPAHRIGLRGLAVPSVDSFLTPLGSVPVDREAVAALLRRFPHVVPHDAAHAPEHSLEVHLPFLQVVLDRFQMVPVLVGGADTEEVASVLEYLWGGPETVVVVSTDLSHYHDYVSARVLDLQTSEAIEAYRPEGIDSHRACGFACLKGLLEVASRRRLDVVRLDLRNSGDTAGTRERVVGYGAWALTEPDEAA